MTSKKLYSLLLKTSPDYEQNLQKLLEIIKSCEENSIIVANEVCLTGFDYKNFEKAAEFSVYATKRLKEVIGNKTVIITMIEKKGGKFYNTAKVFYNHKVVKEQSKVKLFKLGDEDKYFSSGKIDDIEIFEIDGIKLGILICFELRFKDLWRKLEGADIIAIPSMWGSLRKKHLDILTSALAIMNQCYVISSDSKNKEYANTSKIVSPFGEEFKNNDDEIIEAVFDKKEISKMRRYLDVGIGWQI